MTTFYIHSPDVPPPPFEGKIQYRTPEGEDTEITAAHILQLTGAHYVRVSFPSRDYASKIDTVFLNKVFLSVQHVEASDENLRLVHLQGEQKSVNLGVIAAKKLYRGQTICHYHGQLVTDYEKSGSYLLGSSNAKLYRNLAGFLNHGLPNAHFVQCTQSEVDEWAVVALEDIEKDNMVCVHYGSDYPSVTIGTHIELRYAEVRAFAKSEHFYQNGEKLHYIVENPSTWLELYFNGDWSWRELHTFFTTIKWHTVPAYFATLKEWVAASLKTLDPILQERRELKAALYDEIKMYFLDAARRRSVLGALYALKVFAGHLSETLLTSSSWSEIRPKLDPYIEAWAFLFKNRLKQKPALDHENPLHRIVSDVQKELPFSFV